MNQIDAATRDIGLARLAATSLQWTVVPPSTELSDTAERLLLAYPLRAGDALQLAAALKAAARDEGFAVEP